MEERVVAAERREQLDEHLRRSAGNTATGGTNSPTSFGTPCASRPKTGRVGARASRPEAQAVAAAAPAFKIPFVDRAWPEGDVTLAKKEGKRVGSGDEDMGGARAATVRLAGAQPRGHRLRQQVRVAAAFDAAARGTALRTYMNKAANGRHAF